MALLLLRLLRPLLGWRLRRLVAAAAVAAWGLRRVAAAVRAGRAGHLHHATVYLMAVMLQGKLGVRHFSARLKRRNVAVS